MDGKFRIPRLLKEVDRLCRAWKSDLSISPLLINSWL
jgi:hypothetical protein